MSICKHCNGHGRSLNSMGNPYPASVGGVTCPSCNGTGADEQGKRRTAYLELCHAKHRRLTIEFEVEARFSTEARTLQYFKLQKQLLELEEEIKFHG